MDNREFWNERYETLPRLGSGPGSRGIAQHYKAHLLKKVLLNNRIRSIVDVGCGDMCWLRTDRLSVKDLDAIRFTGFDISEIVIQRNRQAFPGLEFREHDLSRFPLTTESDLLLCFDVLIHQTVREQFVRCLQNLLNGITHHALVSYKNPAHPRTAIKPYFGEFDPTIEAGLRRYLAELGERNQLPHPKVTTAFFGPLPNLVSGLSTGFRVTHVGDYNFQSVYEISSSERLRR